jgi:hypothetical protein
MHDLGAMQKVEGTQSVIEHNERMLFLEDQVLCVHKSFKVTRLELHDEEERLKSVFWTSQNDVIQMCCEDVGLNLG